MRLKIWFVALVLLAGCKTTPPPYRLCTIIDNKTDPLFFHCESTDPKAKGYSIWLTDAEREGYLGLPIEDYRAIVKYAKQVQKDLERCRK